MNESNSTEPLSVIDYPEYKAAVWIWKIGCPCLIIFGTIGNLMSILVLTRSTMRKSTVSVYLIVLSVCDILVLYTGLLRQAIRYFDNFDIRQLSALSCKINMWMVYFTLDMSVWILVAVTTERIISVWLPHKVKSVCTHMSAIITIIVIGTVLLIVNSHFLYGMGEIKITVGNSSTTDACEALSNDYENFVIHVWPWIDLCFFCLIPFSLLILGNISIIVKVCETKKAKMRRSQTNAVHVESYNKKASSMTAMLLVLNLVFLVCTSPISVYLIGEPYWVTENVTDHQSAQHALIWAVVNILMYTNNSINFLLYCLSGSRFREELRNIFKKHNRIRPEVSMTRANDSRIRNRQTQSDTTNTYTGNQDEDSPKQKKNLKMCAIDE